VPVTLVGLADVGITEAPEETGISFQENAILKAKFYAEKSKLPTLADDGGLEIDALNGEPGVKSHRWIHQDREDTDEELIQYTLDRMKDIVDTNRGAQLRTGSCVSHSGRGSVYLGGKSPRDYSAAGIKEPLEGVSVPLASFFAGDQ